MIAAEATQIDTKSGLTESEVQRLRAQYGFNEIEETAGINPLVLFVKQFQSSVVVLLIVATGISFALQEHLQAMGIIAAIAINAVVGFITEYRANVSLAQLRTISQATIRARRSGGEVELPVRELVPGDVVLFDPGTRVPADVRVVDCAAFSCDESALTGESVPVFKSKTEEVEPDSDKDLAFQGTLTTSGRATAVVVSTGRHTRLGALGRLLTETVKGETPLSQQLDHLGSQLTTLTIGTCVFVGIVGVLHQEPFVRMLETSIALAVAAIPEGLPVIATLAMAIGIKRMVQAKALVRHLAAVETLGSTTVICTDKTGTLTENRMTVTDLVLPLRRYTMTGSGYEPVGELLKESGAASASDVESVRVLLKAAALCCDATVEEHEDEGWHVHGDPTEGALIAAAHRVGLEQIALQSEYPRLCELPFELARKRMSTVHKCPDGTFAAFTKGSPETIIAMCKKVLLDGQVKPLTQEEKDSLLAENKLLAHKGLRVLGVAQRSLSEEPTEDAESIEKNLVFLGLIGMYDKPKDNVKEAVESCHRAGIRVIMLTGDQPATAQAVAGNLNIAAESTAAAVPLNGDIMKSMPKEELEKTLSTTCVLSRVTPEQKLEIVQCLQKSGEIVAMTGDGLNDAPALKQANIGIAMGEQGTDLAREAADLVLTNDNFSTIVKAVEQGRLTYANIKRAVGYLLTASVTSVLVVLLGIVSTTGLVLLPLQLLWLNLIMHVFPGLGFVMQSGDADSMSRPPRKASDQILRQTDIAQILVRSFIVSVATVAACAIDRTISGPIKESTIALSTVSLALLLQSWSWLSVDRSRFSGLHGALRINWPMLSMTAIGLLMALIAIYAPPLREILSTTALNGTDMAVIAMCSVLSYMFSMMCGQMETFAHVEKGFSAIGSSKQISAS